MYHAVSKGPFIFFLEVGGAWWDLRGPCQKIWLEMGGQPKNMVCEGGVTKKIPFKFGSDSICNNANISTRMPKNSVCKVLKIQIFPAEHAPGPPTLLYTQRQLYPTNCFVTKHSQENVNCLLASAAWPILKRLNN